MGNINPPPPFQNPPQQQAPGDQAAWMELHDRAFMQRLEQLATQAALHTEFTYPHLYKQLAIIANLLDALMARSELLALPPAYFIPTRKPDDGRQAIQPQQAAAGHMNDAVPYFNRGHARRVLGAVMRGSISGGTRPETDPSKIPTQPKKE